MGYTEQFGVFFVIFFCFKGLHPLVAITQFSCEAPEKCSVDYETSPDF